MKILQMLRRREQTAEEKRVNEQRELWAEYRELLMRGDNITDQQTARLAEIVDALGLSVAEVELHAIVLEENLNAESIAAEREELETARDTAQAKIDDLREQIRRLGEQQRNHIENLDAARNRLKGAVEAAEDECRRIAAFFPELIEGKAFADPLPHNEQHMTAPNNRISQAAKSRGITLSVRIDEQTQRKQREEQQERSAERKRQRAESEKAHQDRLLAEGQVSRIS